MRGDKEIRNVWVAGGVVVFLAWLFSCQVAHGQEIHAPRRPSKRVAPAKNAQECQYVASPWGVPCHVDCSLHFYPMFFDENRIVYFKLMTDQNKFGPTETSFDFSEQDGVELNAEWNAPLRWVEWYARGPGEEFPVVPLKGCYCNEREAKIYVCINGEVDHILSP